MRSLRLEHYFLSEVVLHFCGPTQSVAKCDPYSWSIQYLFVLRGANKMDYVLLKIIQIEWFFISKNIILALRTEVERFDILPIDGR